MNRAVTHIIAISLLGTLLSSCTSLPGARYSFFDVGYDETLGQCVELSLQFRAELSELERSNAAGNVIGAFPFLSRNRFLDELATDLNSDAQRQAWISEATYFTAAITEAENRTLAEPWPDEELDRLQDCGFALATEPSFEAVRVQLFDSLIPVADHYASGPQVLGLFPLLRPIFKWRIEKLHKEEKSLFEQAKNFANAVSYGYNKSQTLNDETVRDWFAEAYENSELNLPRLSSNSLEQLSSEHAPRFLVETLGDHDKLGVPRWKDGEFFIDTSEVVTYFLPSYTQFNGENLLQLNYVVWFPARQPKASVDLYSGKYDGLIWRVTLNNKGQVLLYDSIHSCGCYHKYFIVDNSLVARQSASSDEPANVFDLSDLDLGRNVRIWLTSNEHYVVDVDGMNAEAQQSYTLRSYNDLYALDTDAGPRSLFSEHGIVPGSERLERFTLWPTGIRNVGAMRQWGTHATGFVDRQHFDDARLLDLYFQSRQ